MPGFIVNPCPWVLNPPVKAQPPGGPDRGGNFPPPHSSVNLHNGNVKEAGP